MGSLADDIEAEYANPRNPVKHALEKLDEQDRESLLNALDAGEIRQTALASMLTRHTGVTVTDRQLSDYKRKELRGQW